MRTFVKDALVVIIGIAILYAGYFYWQNLSGNEPAIGLPETDIPELVEAGNKTDLPLKLPEDFSLEILAKDLPGARVIAFDREGNMWVSRTSRGVVTKVEIRDGRAVSQNDVFRNLRNPHGLAFDPKDPNTLYIAEEHRVVKTVLDSDAPLEKIADLPAGGGHYTRTIKFGPDDKLYVSIGSSCNVCRESDERRAAIYTMNRDGSDFQEYAKGLRNTVFFTWSEVDGRMWGTDMGRDLLGDNLPPEEINIIEKGKDYGWPICYGNKVHDTNFDKNQYIRDPCADTQPPYIEMQAHSAPLGIAFIPEEGWPREYWYNLIIAFHGSWNRSEPTGYKLVRIILDEKGKYIGMEDFISGWLQGSNSMGRPVDVVVQPGGTMYVSDDKAGAIYKVQSTKQM
jgi:glucose/arabinose dehydrogenase